MKHKIDISTEEKRKEIYDIFNSLTSKNKIHEYFKISDNKNGSEYIKQIANEIGFDLNIYKERKKKFCLNCGKEFIKYPNKINKFCSNKCQGEFSHKKAYKLFLEGDESIMRGNYNPKPFKDFILEEQGDVCAICGIPPIWNEKSLVFILDHIDGNAANNRRDNLRCICPNCDSQLDTYKSKNKNSKRRNYWREKNINIKNNVDML